MPLDGGICEGDPPVFIQILSEPVLPADCAAH